jgi:hypothetical protein
VRDRTDAENEAIREKFHIMTAGDDIPPPIPEFRVSLILNLPAFQLEIDPRSPCRT